MNTEIVSSCLGTEQRGRLNIRNKRSEYRQNRMQRSSCLGTEQRGRLNVRNKRSECRDSQFVFRHRTERTSEC